MRRRRFIRGFTLVELMMVVVIMGILAALGTYGVRRYTHSSKTAEALQNVGAIGRAVRLVSTRETMAAALLAANQQAANTGSSNGKSGKGNNGKGATVVRNTGLCDTSTAVPKSMNSVKGRKYQPNHKTGKDYDTGDQYTGWKCLQFSINSPQAYQYRYKVNGPPVEVTLPHGGTPKGVSKDKTWSASAQGDLDGDGRTSWFILQGYITDDREIVAAPAIDVLDGDE